MRSDGNYSIIEHEAFPRLFSKTVIDVKSKPSLSQSGNHSFSFSNNFDLEAEEITLRIRWFGLLIGYILVNLFDRGEKENGLLILNAILTLGAFYAIIDTLWSYRGKVFLSRYPLAISLLEAIFIGLLCHFHSGSTSPFRFYYYLSILVCAVRLTPTTTFLTLLFHGISYTTLTIYQSQEINHENLSLLLLNLILMSWVAWAGTALAGLVKKASVRLSELNIELKNNQQHLEKRIEERTKELQESQAGLVQQEKQAAFGLLAAGIAHEVGNPLAAISSLVQMLKRRNPDDYMGERLELVDEQLKRIQRTLRELVDFSRPANLEKSLCDIHSVVEEALNIAKYYKRKKGRKIITKFAKQLPKIRTVKDQLVQVFLNLILNAMDATQEGGSVEIGTNYSQGWIDISIADDGHGIPENLQQKVFQPYFTTKETGTGLGLFVCKNIIDQMDDTKIELVKTSAEGTTFTVSVTCENVCNWQPENSTSKFTISQPEVSKS